MAAQPTNGRNPAAAFAAVMSPAVPLPAPRGRIAASQPVEDFVEACDSAIDLAFDDVDEADLTPGVDVEDPRAMLKAYLLFLAAGAPYGDGEAYDAGDVDDWFEMVTPRVWSLLGFARPPAHLMVGLAFSLLGARDHQAPELRALIWAVRDFAASNLMPGLRG
jgi:hypothetical protein